MRWMFWGDRDVRFVMHGAFLGFTMHIHEMASEARGQEKKEEFRNFFPVVM